MRLLVMTRWTKVACDKHSCYYGANKKGMEGSGMNDVMSKKPAWRRYLSRFLILLILCSILGCDDVACKSSDSRCGYDVTFSDKVVLTEKSPSMRFTPETKACIYQTYSYTVAYQYADLGLDLGMIRNATEKDKPDVTIKFGTVEHGVLSSSSKNTPTFNYGRWNVSGKGALPKPKEGETAEPLTLVLSVAMQKPLIKLPGKGPTIALPFIGTIIGPAPRDVRVSVSISYSTPSGVDEPDNDHYHSGKGEL
jgi:hypothetical protein